MAGSFSGAVRAAITPRVFWALFPAAALYYALQLMLSRTALVQAFNSIIIPIAVAIIIIYSPAWVRTLLKPGFRLTGPEALSLGVGACWTSDCGTRIYSLLWNALDAPGWLAGGFYLPLLLYINILGGQLHISAPGAMEGGTPTRSAIYMGVVGGVAALLLLTLLWLGIWDVRASPGAKW